MKVQKQPRFREMRRPPEPALCEWRDTTVYWRDRGRIPTTWTMTLQPGFHITVTNAHMHYPGLWVMRCEPWFDTRQIAAESETQAKRMALDLVAQKIDGLAKAMQKVLP